MHEHGDIQSEEHTADGTALRPVDAGLAAELEALHSVAVGRH